jgi:hypothetical protein
MTGVYEPLSGRATWARRALVGAIVLDAVAVISDLLEFSLLQRALWGGVTAAEISANDTRQALVGLAQALLLAVGAVFFLRWFHRAYTNLAAFGTEAKYGTGWAVGSWFVPILGLIRPKRIADEIWTKSDPDLATHEPPRKAARTPAFLDVWWIAFVLSSLLYWGGFNLSRGAEEISEFKTAAAVYAAADALSVAAGVLALIVVKRMTDRQAARAERQAAPA